MAWSYNRKIIFSDVWWVEIHTSSTHSEFIDIFIYWSPPLSIKSCVGVGDIAVLSERWAEKTDQNDHVENKNAPLRPRNCMFDAYMKDSTHIEVKVTLFVFICVISIRYNSLSLGGSGVDFGPFCHIHSWLDNRSLYFPLFIPQGPPGQQLWINDYYVVWSWQDEGMDIIEAVPRGWRSHTHKQPLFKSQ
jgi:hypothetical protein